MNEPIETEVVPPQAVAVRPEVGAVVPITDAKPAMTAAQAKVDAVAALTMSAYERAATLELTPEEAKALQADFPDEAFQPGAAGKEHLIYIEHAHLRDRFNSVFGMGKWAIVPRNRWAEPFKTAKGTEGSRVYVEAMLVVRGCFVGEAVGAMEYYPKNESQNYGDAVEGAKTAAFRRCAKEFGVGLQAWKKDFCKGWWTRSRGGRDFSRKPAQPAQNAPAAKEGSNHTTPAVPARPGPTGAQIHPFPTAESRQKMILALKASPGEPNRDLVTEYFRKLENPAQLMPNEELEQLPLRFVPATVRQMAALSEKLTEFGNGERASAAFPPHPEQAEPSKPSATPPPKVTDNPPKSPQPSGDQDAWRSFPMPFGKHAGVVLEDLEKNYLFGLWANYEVEREYKGKPKSEADIKKGETFRAMLDLAGEHYQFKKP